ncbi:helix-turn-helix domain-containing protein [Rhizorhapis suberifaciens]|uniref:DNA-binding transcriptional regulator YiaG n=1 Tax=Rhizorhapis suberifaciens TaxID=13656 RepID=A0A840HV75_9SPHN|nr:helix-turn-helix domain-containing protein [Rhizorhapis suberifaciens]MBB4641955.1 DNA-binding transcriptional regulator YiaG [Rhizorhapis suberifaciens]
MTARITVVETSLYLSRAERIMTEAERDHVVDVISENPEAGVVIKGTGGLRKMRIALQGRGKRGGGRIVYWFHSPDYPTVLMLAFAKNEADDLSSEQKKRLIAAIEGLRGFRSKTMKDEDFEDLLKSIDEARRWARGEHVEGLRVHHAPAPMDIAAIRKRTGATQDAFARQIGVSIATLRNWEQGRRTPEGPARILLAMLARDPKIVAKTLGEAA